MSPPSGEGETLNVAACFHVALMGILGATLSLAKPNKRLVKECENGLCAMPDEGDVHG